MASETYHDYTNTYPLPLGEAIRALPAQYLKIITRPSVQSFAEERGKASWSSVWLWLNQEGTPLLHLKRGTHVQLEPAAQDLPELALLTTLGWYLHKLQEEDAAATSYIVPVIS